MHANPPSIRTFGHAAAERVAHHLMAETDAEEWNARRVNPLRQPGELVDPRLVVIDAGLGSGCDITVAFMEIPRALPVVRS